MKKIIALLLAVLMLLSVSACGILGDKPEDLDDEETVEEEKDRKEKDDEDEEAEDKDDDTEATEEKTGDTEAPETEEIETEAAPSEDTTLSDEEAQAQYFGYVDGDEYINSFLSLGFSVPEGWSFISTEELLARAELIPSNNLAEQLSSARVLMLMTCANDLVGDSVNIVYEKPLFPLSEEAYINLQLNGIKANLEQIGLTDVEVVADNVSFVGEEHYCAEVSSLINGVPFYEVAVSYALDDGAMAVITACSLDADKLSGFLAAFHTLSDAD